MLLVPKGESVSQELWLFQRINYLYADNIWISDMSYTIYRWRAVLSYWRRDSKERQKIRRGCPGKSQDIWKLREWRISGIIYTCIKNTLVYKITTIPHPNALRICQSSLSFPIREPLQNMTNTLLSLVKGSASAKRCQGMPSLGLLADRSPSGNHWGSLGSPSWHLGKSAETISTTWDRESVCPETNAMKRKELYLYSNIGQEMVAVFSLC